MCPKDADGKANSVDPDHTIQEQFDLGLPCFPRNIKALGQMKIYACFRFLTYVGFYPDPLTFYKCHKIDTISINSI